ncbi:hypothetical protein [Ornithinicoccus hortensis]|uniref:Dolichyl-phosphate-mannose-protein mannosyltransferase n=1 Tax=Ornithinicoccus hortensis TaxID=82346 RepID=A0A542YPV9_9MICO|nr:hypothetical protein [Ornithinicoccus hortensis]TQL50140.1 hypothetical protein FB467_1243 [Ornithinicoccus hortensis]
MTTRPTGRFLLTVLAIYTVLRLFTTAVLLWITHSQQDPVIFTDEYPRYFDVATAWDGKWYREIAEQGYPPELPRYEDGTVRQNPWAFYPIFPKTAALLMHLTGQPFEVVAPLLATVIGYAAVLVMALLLHERVGRVGTLAAVTLYAAFPASPTLQVAYTESLAILLLCLVLLLLSKERWLWAAGVAVLTGLARPIALPLGVVALVAVFLRWRARGERPLGAGEVLRMLAALVGCGVSGLIWPALVWRGTGEPDGYTTTMSAWRGGEEISPFQPTLDLLEFLFGDRGTWLLLGGTVLLLVAVLGPWARALGAELRAWLLAYPFYLAAALDPWTSIYRYLLMMFPLFVVFVGAGWRPGDRKGYVQPTWLTGTRLVVLLVLFLGWQVWWTWELFMFVPPRDDPP